MNRTCASRALENVGRSSSRGFRCLTSLVLALSLFAPAAHGAEDAKPADEPATSGEGAPPSGRTGGPPEAAGRRSDKEESSEGDRPSKTQLETSTASRQSAQDDSTADPRSAQELYAVDSEYARKVFEKVDSTINKEFFDAKAATESWPSIAAHHRNNILEAGNLKELSNRINAALAELKVSHTQFVTINDENFYFLKNLFASFQKNIENPIGEYLGIGLGGQGFRENQVRYVLDGGPAAIAGIKRGDTVKGLNGKNIIGLLSFKGTADTTVTLQVIRNGKPMDIPIRPLKKDYYEAYLEASKKSAKIISTPAGSVGYLRLWCGGKSKEVVDEVMEGSMAGTKAMILDLRDGFGGNSLEDLDRFYRPPAGYPVFKTYGRRGRKSLSQLTYSKPLITLINGGSRSGKELLAFSLKNSKRGTLVGEKTAGAVLAGRLFPIDDRCALYLAVLDGTVNGVRLEAVGVEPDIKCSYPADSAKDTQLEAAVNAAQAAIRQGTNHKPSLLRSHSAGR
ncbi:MAG: PDZ domain-containing protein [Candidatus Obscuribacterales bacterium]|nr:PDZ domain-containing protein [Candidatus Obscuribacterales bacterium]